MPTYILLGGSHVRVGLPVNRNSLPLHAGTVGDFGERIHMSINFKQRLIVYLAFELILEKVTVTLSPVRWQFFEEFPSLIYWLLLFFWNTGISVLFSFKVKKKRAKSLQRGIAFCSILWLNQYNNSSQQLKRWSGDFAAGREETIRRARFLSPGTRGRNIANVTIPNAQINALLIVIKILIR